MGSWLCHRPAAWPQVRASWYRGGHEAVDVVGPVARPVARAAVWGRRSVHRSEKMISWRRFGAFVYTVATLRTDVRTQECTQIGENSLSEPFWGICVHCCDVSCDASCVRWHECPNHHGAPAVPPRWPPLAWSGRQNSCERRRCRIGVFAEAATHTNPREAE